jgi:hypothetical protein
MTRAEQTIWRESKLLILVLDMIESAIEVYLEKCITSSSVNLMKILISLQNSQSLLISILSLEMHSEKLLEKILEMT